MYKLPKGFPKHGMDDLHGKQYINHVGLCWLADTKKPGWCSEVRDYVERTDENGMPIYVQIRGRVWDETTSHEAIGDASIHNTKLRDCLPRIADTRWKNRALRLFVGWNEVTIEEMKEGAGGGRSEQRGETPSRPAGGNRGQQGAVDRHSDDVLPLTEEGAWGNPSEVDPTCPVCKDGTGVWDNRETAKGRQPLWSCKNKADCKHGSRYGWGSWDPDFFAKEARATAKDPDQAPDEPEDLRDGSDWSPSPSQDGEDGAEPLTTIPF